MTALDPATPVRVSVAELLTIPRGVARDQVIRLAVTRHTAVRRSRAEAARAELHASVEITPDLVTAEAHRLEAAADHIYAAMATDYTDRIRNGERVQADRREVPAA